MRFTSVEIKNYRQYRNLELSFEKGDNDLQIIIGDNGTGKTNLLNAFTWCLYGSEPHLGNETKEKGEPRLSKSAILEMLKRGTEVEDMSVRIKMELEDGMLEVYRTVPFRVKGAQSVTELHHEAKFRVTLIRPSGTKLYVGEDAQEQIWRILPETIREYIFFDGEQLDNYFEDSRAQVLQKAVHSISNIDSITQMKVRTQNTSRDLARRATPKKGSDVDVLLQKMHEYEDKHKQWTEKIETSRAQLEQLDAEIDELAVKLRGLPDVAVLESRIEKLKRQKKESETAYASAVESYCTFARKMYIDFSLYEAAKAALDVIASMEKDNQLPPAIDPSLLKSMLAVHMCEVCKRPLSEQEEERIRQLLELYQVGTETSNLLTSMRGELRTLVRNVESYPTQRDCAYRQIDAARVRVDQVLTDLDEAERDYSGCPNPEELKGLREQRRDYEKEKEKLLSNIGKYEGYATQFKNAAENKRKEYNRAVKEKGLGDEFQVAADFGERAARILERVENEMIGETRQMIEEEAGNFFKGLVWKESKCEHIGLTANYQLSLYDRYGFSCAGTCSAAERNLLALSFTLAMHRVSGFESPLFIDTPIARASGDNRLKFAETLAEVSKGKQLILTFTPDEYSVAIRTIFEPIAASHMRLVMDDDELSAKIQGK